VNYSGKELQKSIFSSLSGNTELADLFGPEKGMRSELPRIEFEGIETHPHENGDECVQYHLIHFSVWSNFYDPSGGQDISGKLVGHFNGVDLTMTGFNLVAFRFLTQVTGKEKAARAWKFEVTFEAITEGKS
jgi:hypothetical protein